MARYAIIVGGLVTNMAESGVALESNWVVTTTADIGWTWDVATGFTPPAAPSAPQTTSISFSQMMTGLVAEGWITEAEGYAWFAGTLPAAAVSVINTLPAGQRFGAAAKALRPSEVVLTDPLVQALAAAQGKTEAQLNAFFNTYGSVT